MSHMFFEKSTFNQDLSNWDVSRVTNMSWMFASAKGFDQELCGASWVRSKADKLEMFSGSPGSICSALTLCSALVLCSALILLMFAHSLTSTTHTLTHTISHTPAKHPPTKFLQPGVHMHMDTHSRHTATHTLTRPFSHPRRPESFSYSSSTLALLSLLCLRLLPPVLASVFQRRQRNTL